MPSWVFIVTASAFLVLLVWLHSYHARARQELLNKLQGIETQIKTANSVSGRVETLELNAPKIKERVERLEQAQRATENEVNKVAVKV